MKSTKRNLIVMCILACIWLKTITGSSVISLGKSKCSIQKVNYLWNFLGKELIYNKKFNGFKCDIKSKDFTFDLDKNNQLLKNQIFDKLLKIENFSTPLVIEINWSKKLKQSSLTRKLDMFAFWIISLFLITFLIS